MTYLCYIDEAGCTTPLPGAQTDIQPVLVIVGLIVDAAKVRSLTLDFLNLKRQYFPKKFGNGNHQLDDVLVEIKGSDLRSTIRKHGGHADATLKFIDDTLDLLRANEARLFATVWVKGTGKPINSRAIYTSSIQAACRNFTAFLDWRDDTGFMVADSRTPALNTQVSHSIFTQKYRAKGDPMSRLIDLPTFGHSNNHVPLQIADMLCSTLLFPMATASYCAGQIKGKHVKGRDNFIKRRYASRIKALQYRFKDAAGLPQGGIFVADGLQGASLIYYFSFKQRKSQMNSKVQKMESKEEMYERCYQSAKRWAKDTPPKSQESSASELFTSNEKTEENSSLTALLSAVNSQK